MIATLPFLHRPRFVLAFGTSALEGRQWLIEKWGGWYLWGKCNGRGTDNFPNTGNVLFPTWMMSTWVFFSNYTDVLHTLLCVWYIFQFKTFPPQKTKRANILKALNKWEILIRYSLIINYPSLSRYPNPVLLSDHLEWQQPPKAWTTQQSPWLLFPFCVIIFGNIDLLS